MSKMAAPASRCSSNKFWIVSIAPTSSPRVGCTATINLGLAEISRARITFCKLPPDSLRAGTSQGSRFHEGWGSTHGRHLRRQHLAGRPLLATHALGGDSYNSGADCQHDLHTQ